MMVRFRKSMPLAFISQALFGGTFGLPYAITFDFDKMKVSFAGDQPQTQH
jgi:lipid-A-disaccharide synthase-like uncharacterized protein